MTFYLNLGIQDLQSLWHSCALRCVAVRLPACRAGRPDSICQRGTTEKSECKTLISPDPDEGSLLSQQQTLLGSEEQATHQETEVVWQLHVHRWLVCKCKWSRRSCWAPSWVTSTQAAPAAEMVVVVWWKALGPWFNQSFGGLSREK